MDCLAVRARIVSARLAGAIRGTKLRPGAAAGWLRRR